MTINRAILKSYAPAARREFIQAVTDRAHVLGLSEKSIAPVEVQGDVAMIEGRPFPKDVAKRRKDLETRIRRKGFAQVMEEVAYTWFNRFTALRYMELHGYLGHGSRVLSNPSGSDIPEILEKASSIDLPGLNKDKVAELRLAGDKDAELYRLLLITQCNALHKVMPMLFEPIKDATELLMPENLLQTNSPIKKLVGDIPEANWQEIEIIGWLYQFYISEKKSEVIGKVVKSEDIPAATQLFTPNWIVKYMVHNTLGRKWLMTYPDSGLKGTMEFYIEPAEQEPEVQAQLDAITPNELKPEELTFMDPACGSGHILAEAYDLLKEIYLERGYRTRDIPRLILEKNLYGLEIDDRAAQMARFTVLMKARADDRRILYPDNPVHLNILAIQESKGLDLEEMAEALLKERVVELGSPKQKQGYLIKPRTEQQAYLKGKIKPDVTKEELFYLLNLFKDGKTFGSLLFVHEKLKAALPRLGKLIDQALQLDAAPRKYAEWLLPLLQQAQLLAGEYDFVVTNPPYMGSKGLNSKLKEYLKDNYADVKSDMFSAFIARNFEMSVDHAQLGFMSPYVWMFISSYEKLRQFLVDEKTITSLIQLEYSGFDGATVPICTYTLENTYLPDFNGSYIRLSDFRGANNQAPKTFEAIQSRDCGWFYTASASDFKKIPGSPIAYWLSDRLIEAFEAASSVGAILKLKHGLSTGNNEKFIRTWPEVDYGNIFLNCPSQTACKRSKYQWYPYFKGGEYRKWIGNRDFVLNYFRGGQLMETLASRGLLPGFRHDGKDFFFREAGTWSNITSSFLSMRYTKGGFCFDQKGSGLFAEEPKILKAGILYFNSVVAREFLSHICPTLDFSGGGIGRIPFLTNVGVDDKSQQIFQKLTDLTSVDWNAYERSWDFQSLPILMVSSEYSFTLTSSYTKWVTQNHKIVEEMKRLEVENNRIFIESYGLQDELNPDVPLEEITLTCNPHYRYGPGKTEEEYEALLRADTMKELISYAIGSMMGRYSLDEPGLIYAHSGNEGFDPSRYQTFPADDDGIIPVMDEDWFADDAANRFVEFIKTTWPPEALDENLKFVADSLSPKRNEAPVETIRRYLSDKFFKDHHLKVYKKRPIYWLFSSGKHKAFQCLIYLHRYNESTLSRMRALYVTPLQGKYKARVEYLEKERDNAGSTSTRNKLQKELDTMRKKQQELREYDEVLRHYADQRISLDLDDGVKVNYGKFGTLMAEVKAVTGKKG